MLSILLSLVPTLGDGPRTPGFAYLGTGYDVLFGNPLSTNGMGDPGLMDRSLFQFKWTDGMTTTDGKYAIPDMTNARVFDSCSTDMDTQMYNSAYSYQKIIDNSFDIEATIGLPKKASIDFSLGVDVRNTRNHTATQKSIYAHVSATCAAYQLSMNVFLLPNVSMDFQYGVKEMPLEFSMDAYAEILQAYGSHYISALKAGGRWGMQMMFKAKSYDALLDHHVDVTAGIGFTAGQSSGKLNITSSKDEKTMYAIGSAIAKNATFNTGGQFNPNPTVWMDTVKEDPMPVHMTLTSITTLFNTMNLPMETATNVAKKKANMEKAIMGWCDYQMTQNPTFNCTPQAPIPWPTPAPIDPMAIRRLCVQNEGGFQAKFHMVTKSGISANSGSFNLGETECIDGSDVDAKMGDTLGCEVHAVAGNSVMCGKPWKQYSSQSNLQSNYKCSGSTIDFTCDFVSVTTIGAGPGSDPGYY